MVIGIDGGGTYTRVVVADLKGNILGFAKSGRSHPGKNLSPSKNIKQAIIEALKQANQSVHSVKCFVGGFAGLNDPSDKEWAMEYVRSSGIKGPIYCMNDAEVAQFGAFLGQPGIIAIAGTGSIILGRNETGAIIRNYDFHHTCQASARFLSYFAIYEMITQKITYEDRAFINEVLKHWNVNSINELRLLAAKGFSPNRIEAIQHLSNMGRIVTEYAVTGNSIVYKACENAVKTLVTGIQLVSSMFASAVVPVSFGGGVVSHTLFQNLLKERLSYDDNIVDFDFQTPILPPVLGAILYAYHELEINTDNKIKEKLIRINKQDNFS